MYCNFRSTREWGLGSKKIPRSFLVVVSVVAWTLEGDGGEIFAPILYSLLFESIENMNLHVLSLLEH